MTDPEGWDALEFGSWDFGTTDSAAGNGPQYPTAPKRLMSVRPDGKKRSNKPLSQHQLQGLLDRPVSLRNANQPQTNAEDAAAKGKQASGKAAEVAAKHPVDSASQGKKQQNKKHLAKKPETTGDASGDVNGQVTVTAVASPPANAAPGGNPSAPKGKKQPAAQASIPSTGPSEPEQRGKEVPQLQGSKAMPPPSPSAAEAAIASKGPRGASEAEPSRQTTDASAGAAGAADGRKKGKQPKQAGGNIGSTADVGHVDLVAASAEAGKPLQRPAKKARLALQREQKQLQLQQVQETGSAGEDHKPEPRPGKQSQQQQQEPKGRAEKRKQQDQNIEEQLGQKSQQKQQQQKLHSGNGDTAEPRQDQASKRMRDKAQVGNAEQVPGGNGDGENAASEKLGGKERKQGQEGQRQGKQGAQQRGQGGQPPQGPAAAEAVGKQQPKKQKGAQQQQEQPKGREAKGQQQEQQQQQPEERQAKRGRTVASDAKGEPAVAVAPTIGALSAPKPLPSVAASLTAALGGRAATAAAPAAASAAAAPAQRLTHAAALAAMQQKSAAAAAAAAAAGPSSAGGCGEADDDNGGVGAVAAGGRRLVAQGKKGAKAGGVGFLDRMRARLAGGRFRYLNEELYTRSGDNAFSMMKDQPELFTQYHDGFQKQTRGWPKQPVDLAISWLMAKRSEIKEVADFGCGDAKIAASVAQTVHSFDLVASAPGVIACNMASVPLPECAVDAAVFSLALMGTDYGRYLEEAVRVLKPKGWLWIAEVRSRFAKAEADGEDSNEGDSDEEEEGGRGGKAGGRQQQSKEGDEDFKPFLACLKRLGLKLLSQDASNKMFVVWVLRKEKAEDGGKKAGGRGAGIAWPPLKACVYKKR